MSRSGLVSQPNTQGHPAAPARTAAPKAQAQRVESAARELKSATTQVTRASTRATVERTVGKAKAALDSARRSNVPRAELQRLQKSFDKLQRDAKEKSSRITHDEAKNAALAAAAGSEVQAGLFKHRAQSSVPAEVQSPPPQTLSAGTATSIELASQWGASYERETGNELVEVDLGTCTYTFDIAAGRVVCVKGHTIRAPKDSRDHARQAGHPAVPDYEKGHLIANMLGGGMEINVVPQNKDVNRGKGSRWSAIERQLAKSPGTAVAIHVIYEGDSDRPAAFEYGYDDPDAGFQTERFENPPSSGR